MSFPFRHPIEVRFQDCDAMRHVHNAVYFTCLEQARIAYWRALRGSCRIEDITFILARAECDYRHPIRLDDPVDVCLRIASLGRSSFVVEYKIVDRDDGRVFATAKTVLVMYDYEKGAPMRIPEEMRKRMGEVGKESGIRNRESGEDQTPRS